MLEVPELTTDRLLLSAPSEADFETYRAFYADAHASALYGGPFDTAQAWRKLAYDIGHWALRGHGLWSLLRHDTQAMIGGCGLVRPEGWPRAELTWWIIPAARRQGFALEASRAAITYGYDMLKWESVETHMNDDNEPARRLAIALGGKIIAREQFPDGLTRDIYALPHPHAAA